MYELLYSLQSKVLIDSLQLIKFGKCIKSDFWWVGSLHVAPLSCLSEASREAAAAARQAAAAGAEPVGRAALPDLTDGMGNPRPQPRTFSS